MTIYISTKVMPYVYMCIHKETGKIYIGSRYSKGLKLPSHLDLPKYKTSSLEIKGTFSEFNWYILAEFYNGDDAYDFEQQLISEYWGNPLLLNKQYRLCNGNKRFKSQFGRIVSDETKSKIAEARSKQVISEEQKKKISETLKGRPSPNKGKKASAETRAKISAAGKLRVHSDETKAKQSAKAKLRPPRSEETRAKMSASSKKRWSAAK